MAVFGLAIFGAGTCRAADAGGKPSATPANATADSAAVDVLLQDLPVVEAAALHAQTLAEAPANVSVITAEQIRRYGYRTLGEALAGVRGFYLTSDRAYNFVGVRGFSLPGDYNTRFLVMLNGHPLTENIYNSNGFFGEDFGLDMDLVERIEVIRGPTSSLYGSNGMLANINIVTKSPVDHPGAWVSTETGSFGTKKAMVSSSSYLGKGANLLIAASVFNTSGQRLPFADASSETGRRMVSGVDAEHGYHALAVLTWHNWSFTGYFNSRDKRIPFSWSNSLLDGGSRQRDGRNFVGSSYTRPAGPGKLRWQLNYDQYRYDDRWDYGTDDGGVEDNRTINRGDWINTQLTYAFPIRRVGDLTVGMQGNVELRNLQVNYDVSPSAQEYLRINRPDRSAAVFAQQEWGISRRWKGYFGLRYDVSRNFSSFASPRLALVFTASPTTVYKFVYGHPFRNPSTYEQYYDDNGLWMTANPSLRQETAHTFEFAVERKLSKGLTGIVNLYHYRTRDFIQTYIMTDGLQQYANLTNNRSTGVEFELDGRVNRRLEVTGSLAVQRAIDSRTGLWLPNSPGRIAKARVATPVVGRRVWLASAFQYFSARLTGFHEPVRPVALADVTLSTSRLHPQFDLVLGLRNALNWRYQDPVDLALGTMRADRRAVYLKLIWHSGE